VSLSVRYSTGTAHVTNHLSSTQGAENPARQTTFQLQKESQTYYRTIDRHWHQRVVCPNMLCRGPCVSMPYALHTGSIHNHPHSCTRRGCNPLTPAKHCLQGGIIQLVTVTPQVRPLLLRPWARVWAGILPGQGVGRTCIHCHWLHYTATGWHSVPPQEPGRFPRVPGPYVTLTPTSLVQHAMYMQDLAQCKIWPNGSARSGSVAVQDLAQWQCLLQAWPPLLLLPAG
jgi:hypothetical protein